MWWNQGRPCLESQGFKSGDLEGQAVGNFQLMILSPPNRQRSNSFTQRAMCGGVPLCISTVIVSHPLAWRAGIMDCCNNEAYHWPVTCMSHCPLCETSAPPPLRWRQNHQPTISYSLNFSIHWLISLRLLAVRIPQGHGLPWSHHISIRP